MRKYSYSTSIPYSLINLSSFLSSERKVGFEGSPETLRKLLHDMQFKFKGRDGRRYLLETPRITALRVKFLIRFMERKKAHRVMVYTDETWYFQKGSGKTKEWQDNDIRSCSTKHISGGQRHILVHAGTSEGFLPGAELNYSSGKTPVDGDDYHGEVNTATMEKYWKKQIIPNLPHVPASIVLDNASYHKSQVK